MSARVATYVLASTILVGSLPAAARSQPTRDASAQHFVDEVSVTILSSNLANGATIGEWGLSALVQADGQCLLFDAGRHPDTVLRNAEVLGVDLSCVTDVVLSHFHFDHTTCACRERVLPATTLSCGERGHRMESDDRYAEGVRRGQCRVY